MTLAASAARAGAAPCRRRLRVSGPVQGVGFRPLAHRLARALGLGGWVANALDGVVLEVEGDATRLGLFVARLRAARPGLAIDADAALPARGETAFAIRPSRGGRRTAPVPADVATCAACLAELFDPASRRHRYPFVTCAGCGPRQTIARDLPWDRARTTMAAFTPCAACRAEYDDPDDRRFHAETNACAACGPRLALLDARGGTLAGGDEAALAGAVAALGAGLIVAVKGVGGFHLMVDATNEDAVRRLRRRKARPAKPLAVMAPDLAWLRHACAPTPLEEELAAAPEAPIVLVARRAVDAVAPAVAPDTPLLGVMLPYAPLHHLLVGALARPLVATSGNRGGEPLCADERDAVAELAGISDRFLIHDRAIAAPLDDSIVRVLGGRPAVLRRARGYAPAPIVVDAAPPAVAGLGAHLKTTVALPVGRAIHLAPYVGDLDGPRAVAAHAAALARLVRLHGVAPRAVACDLHPDCGAALAAERSGLPIHRVQHHEAHVLAAMADAGIAPPVLGVAWDGLGLGSDGVLWGGEWLHVGARDCRRVAHLRPFPLPGGERAVREGRRAALGLLWALAGAAAFDEETAPLATFGAAERAVLRRVLARGLNAPLCTSVGRLLDAVASLLDLRHASTFEGEAATALEHAAGEVAAGTPYALDPVAAAGGPLVLDWAPLVRGVLADVRAGVPAAVVAARTLEGLAAAAVGVASAAGTPRVVLAGGCFQNKRLLESTVRGLRAAGLEPHWHRRVPPNDGAIALGQVLAAARRQAGAEG